MMEREPLARQGHAGLRGLDQAERAGTTAAIGASFFLDAARGCWLLGQPDQAQRFYRLAVPRLLEEAQAYGVRGANYGAYALPALGAAWGAADPRGLAGLSHTVEAVASHELATSANTLVRAGLELTIVRAAWWDQRWSDTRDALQRLQEHVGRMEPATRAQWDSERGAVVLPIYQRLVSRKGAEAAAAIQRLEAYLLAGIEPPFAIADLVDEEFIVLASAVAASGADLTGLFLPYEPGAVLAS